MLLWVLLESKTASGVEESKIPGAASSAMMRPSAGPRAKSFSKAAQASPAPRHKSRPVALALAPSSRDRRRARAHAAWSITVTHVSAASLAR